MLYKKYTASIKHRQITKLGEACNFWLFLMGFYHQNRGMLSLLQNKVKKTWKKLKYPVQCNNHAYFDTKNCYL